MFQKDLTLKRSCSSSSKRVLKEALPSWPSHLREKNYKHSRISKNIERRTVYEYFEKQQLWSSPWANVNTWHLRSNQHLCFRDFKHSKHSMDKVKHSNYSWQIKSYTHDFHPHLAQTPHESSIDSHQLLPVHPIRLVQDDPDLVVEPARNIFPSFFLRNIDINADPSINNIHLPSASMARRSSSLMSSLCASKRTRTRSTLEANHSSTST